MSSTALMLIENILANTGQPPGPDNDPADVLVALHEMAMSRESDVAKLQQHLGPEPQVGPECRAALAELKDRDTRWQAAAQHARQAVTRRAASVARIGKRGYGPASHTRTA